MVHNPGQRWVGWAIDAALAAACVQIAVMLALEYSASAGGALRAVTIGLATTHGLVVGVRRLFPRLVAGWMVATALAYAALGFPPAFLGPAGVIGLYTVAVRARRAESLRWLLAAEVVMVGGGLSLGQDWDSVALYAAFGLGAWGVGDQVRRRQEEASAHAGRARLLERAREELAEYAVAQERLRIARELHDVVAHSMSVVALNAGAGRVVAEQDPAAARDALATIESVTRTALAEMRQLMAVLRDGKQSEGLAPLPGLKDLPQLAARLADAGLCVDVRIDGDRPELPGGLDLAAYRIIQEAVTNTLKHSGATSTAVVVRYRRDAVTVTITDPGPARTTASSELGTGTGLIGMRERVALYGGRLEAGGQPGGGYRVEAFLPLDGVVT